MSTESSHGSICVVVDGIQKTGTPKLDSVKPNSVDAFYMLAAISFDLYRKMEYIFKATREFGLRADSTLAREVLRDNESISDAGTSWEAIARKTEEIMLRLYREIYEDHERLLKQAAGGSSERK